MVTVFANDPETGRYYRLRLTPQQVQTVDNGCLISYGLTVGTDLRRAYLTRLINAGQATEVSRETWNHSGCQSGCILRGDPKCVW